MGNLCYVHPITPSSNDTKIMHTVSNKRKAKHNEKTLWYLRLGHISLNRIKRLIQDGSMGPLDMDKIPQCKSCLEDKMTRRSFKTKDLKASKLLDLVHIVVCRLMMVHARGGFEYFITFTNDYLRYRYVYLMQHKSEAFMKFKQFMAKVENKLEIRIKVVRSNRGDEYLLGEYI